MLFRGWKILGNRWTQMANSLGQYEKELKQILNIQELWCDWESSRTNSIRRGENERRLLTENVSSQSMKYTRQDNLLPPAMDWI